jgi:hypothetical protein
VLQINRHEPDASFGWSYLQQAKSFYSWASAYYAQKKAAEIAAVVPA